MAQSQMLIQFSVTLRSDDDGIDEQRTPKKIPTTA